MPRPGVPDPSRRRAGAEGYVSRAVYKLKAIDEKYHLFRPGQRVLDLGCSPGSWLQYIGARVGPQGLVVGVDLITPRIDLSPPIYFLKGDFLSLAADTLKAISPVFEVVGRLKKTFRQCPRIKPAGSRQASLELYLLGLKKRTGPVPD